MSELHLDEYTFARVKQLADARNISVEELIAHAVDQLASGTRDHQARVELIGAFEDCADLLDEIVDEAYRNRQRLPLRARPE